MDNWKMRIFFLTGMMVCFSFLLSDAQPLVKTSVDKSEILIGDQFKLTIEAKFSPDDYKINWPVIPDSLHHFEVINRGRLDSVYNDNLLSGIVQTLTLTSFDSGKWVLPTFLVNIKPAKEDTTYILFTDSLPITVAFAQGDTTNQLKDIKPIREADSINTMWYWIGSGVLLVALIIFLIWFYRYWKRNKGTVPFKVKTSSYEQAIKELEYLNGYNLADPVQIKIVHSKLAEILKQYLSQTQKINYHNKTTGDILILLSDQSPDKELPAKAAASLRCGDAVKFAKYLPPVVESEVCIQSIKEIINTMHQHSSNSKLSTPNLKP
jgi:hypothetical protein